MKNSLSICLPWVESQNQASDSKNEILCEVWNIPALKYSALSLLIIHLSLSASVFLFHFLPSSLPSPFLFVCGRDCEISLVTGGTKKQKRMEWRLGNDQTDPQWTLHLQQDRPRSQLGSLLGNILSPSITVWIFCGFFCISGWFSSISDCFVPSQSFASLCSQFVSLVCSRFYLQMFWESLSSFCHFASFCSQLYLLVSICNLFCGYLSLYGLSASPEKIQ